MASEWYFRVAELEYGPFSVDELIQQAAEGKIQRETELRKGDGPWVAARKVAGLFDRAAQLPPTPTVAPAAPPPLPDPSPAAEPPPLFAAPVPMDKFEVIDAAESERFRVEVLAYRRLGGAKDYRAASTIYFANQAGIRLKQVRITLREGEAITEAGALHFMLGHLQMESKLGGVAGVGRAIVNKFVTKEAAILPRYRGTGEIYLEPSFSHFLVYRLSGEEVICDRGMFYCSEGTLDVGAALQKNVSSALFGGEGLFQTRVKGTGICVFESPVPADEVIRVDLKDQTLQVDGNFALMRTGRIEFSVEKSAKSLLGTFTSGEGLLQTFRGTGSVWLAPTQDIYQKLEAGGVEALASAPRSSNTAT